MSSRYRHPGMSTVNGRGVEDCPVYQDFMYSKDACNGDGKGLCGGCRFYDAEVNKPLSEAELAAITEFHNLVHG